MKKITNYTLLIFIAFGLNFCIDVPDEFIAPAWDVEVNIPVSTKKYTLADIIKNDPQFVVNNNDPSSLGKITYNQKIEFEKAGLNEGLIFESFDSYTAEKIDEIKIGSIDPITLDMNSEDLLPGASGGTNQIIPPFQVPLNSNFNVSSNFESITFSSGELNFYIYNNLPVEIELHGFDVVNISDGSIVFSQSSNASDWIIIPRYDSVSIPIILDNKTVTGELRFDSQLFSPGSGTEEVPIPTGAAISFKIELKEDFVIRSVIAPLPIQGPIVSQGSIAIQTGDQPTRFQRTVLDTGSFQITVDNHFDLDITLNLSIENLYRANGSQFNRTIALARKEMNKVIELSSMEGWVFDNNGVPTEYLNYGLIITTHDANDPRELAVNDSVILNFSFGDIALRSFIGTITPTLVNIPSSTTELNLGELEETFSFNELAFDNPDIILQVNSPTTFEVLFNGQIEISNGTENNVLYLNDVLLQPSGITNIELQDYGLEEVINSFSNKFPNNYSLSGTATINPNYRLGSIGATDSINGNLDLNLPLTAGIAGGLFVDTVKNTITDDFEDIEKLNYAHLTLELTNEIPISLAFVGTFNDSNGTKVLNLPPRPLYPSNKDTVFVDPPRVDLKGNIISAGYRIQELELFGDEVQKFLSSPLMTFQVKFVTPPKGTNLPVSFNINDELNFKVTAKASYRVDFN
jgi:hypothetical protein